MKPQTFRHLRFESLESRRMLVFDPTAAEQELLEAINRIRINPQAELSVIYTNVATLTSSDPKVTSDTRAFNMNSAQLQSEFAALVPVAPVIWSSALSDAAQTHSSLMIAQRTQSHQLPGEASLGTRVTAAGYTNWQGLGENIYAYAENTFHGHAGFVIDWGNNPPGHRDNIMDADWKEVGIDATPHTPLDGADVGPLVITQDFGTRFNYGNSYIVGVVYQESNGNGRYNAGEGLGSVTITATPVGGGTTYTTTSMTAGGYQLQLPNGTYTVTASGGTLGSPRVINNVVIASANRKVDFNAAVLPVANVAPVNTVPIQQATRPGVPLVFSSANGNQISVNDSDAGGNPVRVTLGVNSGTLTLNSLTGLQFTAGDGTSDATMTFSGTLANINAALNGLSYTPAVGFSGGAAQITLTTNDLGNTGSGGALTDTDSVFVFVYNAFTISGNNLTVVGTGGADSLTINFSDASNYTVTLNGATQSANIGTINSLTFVLGGGSDTVYANLAPGQDNVVMWPETLQANGVGYTIYGTGGNSQYVWAVGAVGTGYFFDSAGNDTYYGLGTNTQMSGPGYYNQLLNLKSVYTYGSGAGVDTAYLYDSSNADILYGFATYASLSGPNAFQHVEKFDSVYGYGYNGSADTAVLYDSPGNETFFGTPNYGALVGPGFLVQATAFSRVLALSVNGGNDTAALYDSSGDDSFLSLGDTASLQGTGFFVQALQFDSIVATSQAGRDTAVFYDTPGNDSFVHNSANSYMLGTNYRSYAVRFAIIYAFAGVGTDTASLSDSTGIDTLTATSNNVTLVTPSQTVYGYSFRNVTAISNAGSRDVLRRGTIDYALTTTGNWFA